jgi:hypothetical protein
MALRQGLPEGVIEQLERAEKLVKEMGLVWWQPVVAYFQGKYYCQEGNRAAARLCFEAGKTAVAQGGSPDYLPLILLELARLSEDNEQKGYLRQAVEAAQQRSRAVDRVTCLQMAGQLLED